MYEQTNTKNVVHKWKGNKSDPHPLVLRWIKLRIDILHSPIIMIEMELESVFVDITSRSGKQIRIGSLC